jgi:aspartyl-tRNA(Asn)/glutamyl-tRNA(Gln) amidotransferase subunit A
MSRAATLHDIRDSVRGGHRTAAEVCREAFARIKAHEHLLHAFVTVTEDDAMVRAESIDRDRSRWQDKPLAGVPVAVKDNIATRGVRTTASSRMLETFVPPYDATVVERLHAAGAVIIGKTNCDEFAMGSSTENSAFGASRNPWSPDRIPGGSSGGSAVAVAARMVALSLGSDTGGSIRQPASLCGIVGLKPSYGRVSRYGLLAFGSSLDHIGPLTTTVRDAALALSAFAGPDERDSTCARQALPDLIDALDGDVRNLRIGVPRALVEGEGIDPHVSAAFGAALDVLVDRGATLVDVTLEHSAAATAVYYLVATAEASSNLARYDGVRYGYRAPAEPGADDLRGMYARTRARGFGVEVKRRIMLGTYVLSAGYYDAYYRKAQQVRTLIRRDYDRAFERVDVIATPTSPTAAFRLGERIADPLQMYLADVFTVSANLTGLPAISVPCGFTPDRLPVGMQLTGRFFDEAAMLRAADAYERATEWWRLEPLSS